MFAPWLAPFLPQGLLTGEHAGIFAATAVFIPAVLLALAVGYALTRHLPVMPLDHGDHRGGIRRADPAAAERDLHQAQAYHHLLFFSRACCSAGSLFGKALLGPIFDSVFHLTEEGWRKLTLRWAVFFLVHGGTQRDGLAHPPRPTPG